MILLSPTLYKLSQSNDHQEEHIDFWYDSLNDCYSNGMETEMILSYIEAIND